VIGKVKETESTTSVWYELNANKWPRAWTGNRWWIAPVVLAPGTNIFQAYAVDTSGNTSPTNRAVYIYIVPGVE
jgi:hypothetical protein